MSFKLTNKVKDVNQICKISKASRQNGKIVGVATGVFDILHIGHALFLKSFKENVDILIVGIDDNETVKHIKGENRPYFDETERAHLLACLDFVDNTFIFSGPFNSDLLAKIKPNYYGISPHDPILNVKKSDASKAGVELFISPEYLKSTSSSKVGRMIRFEYLLSLTQNTSAGNRSGWIKAEKLE